jgi:hypothetical protein
VVASTTAVIHDGLKEAEYSAKMRSKLGLPSQPFEANDRAVGRQSSASGSLFLLQKLFSAANMERAAITVRGVGSLFWLFYSAYLSRYNGLRKSARAIISIGFHLPRHVMASATHFYQIRIKHNLEYTPYEVASER